MKSRDNGSPWAGIGKGTKGGVSQTTAGERKNRPWRPGGRKAREAPPWSGKQKQEEVTSTLRSEDMGGELLKKNCPVGHGREGRFGEGEENWGKEGFLIHN